MRHLAIVFVVFYVLFALPFYVSAATITVSGNSINSAIQSAQSGDTVEINAGVYKEQVDISKPITLVGNGAVWIDGECSRKYGIQITSSSVTIKGIGVKKTQEQGIIVRNTSSSNITIEGNTVTDFNCQQTGDQYAAGIASWYGGSNIKVLNNTITARVDISGGQRIKGNGIWFKSNNDNPSGGGHTISGNSITGGYDGIGGEEEGSDRGSFDKDTVIENNTIKDCWDDGIQTEGGNVNITVKNNRIEGCGTGIAFAPNKIGPLNVLNNTIIGNTSARGVHGQLMCYKIGRGGSGITYLTSNFCSIPGTSDGGDGIQQTNKGVSPIVSRKNVFTVSRYVLEITDSLPAGSSFNEDCFYTSDSGRFIKWSTGRFANLPEFQSATGHEAQGTQSQNCPSTGASTVSTQAIPTRRPTRIIPTHTPMPTPTLVPSPTEIPITIVETQKPSVPKSGWFERTFGFLAEWFGSLFKGKK